VDKIFHSNQLGLSLVLNSKADVGAKYFGEPGSGEDFQSTAHNAGSGHMWVTPEPYQLPPPLSSGCRNHPSSERSQILTTHDPSLPLAKERIQHIDYGTDVVPAAADPRQFHLVQ